ncbi:tRNA lysidine(34) synthetase TilS [Streptomyces tubbatahanensis]|uniref:tRNA(Ile)-lysidine synthase n=1 Tax=Streptomyces tubbatahanensis TaxID=2923272 RepID=A0ABY3XV39_9ACTN|nr:tRNA lysidine(34) synthetase TilS [Streptomyces tubbatahanensis]UNS98223.1 tRNA lysidine(34) synthetase TilS [Streptomyces tubbatahanensis]
MGPHPAVAAIRLAVRRTLHDVLSVPGPQAGQVAAAGGAAPAAGPAAAAPTAAVPAASAPTAPTPRAAAPAEPLPPLVLVACSGGADSMALASALAFEAPRLGVRAGGVTVDHGLQAGSAERAEDVAARLTDLGLAPVESVAVRIARTSTGPEAAAREARYAALDEVAERHGAAAVLLGHTRDDQAETVLLGLARGSGTRSLSGMAAVSGPQGRYRRPFLGVDRQTTRKACMVQSLPVWDDPHNADPAYTRSRVRHEALPALEKALGKGVIEALARTAQLSRDDADALDAWTDDAERAVVRTPQQAASPEDAGDAAPVGRLEDTCQAAPVPRTEDVPGAAPGPRAEADPVAVRGPQAGSDAAAGAVVRSVAAQPGDPVAGSDVRVELDVARLYALPPAVRRRVLRRAAIEAGSPPGSLFARHIEEMDRLLTAWRGQRALNLPGRVEVARQGGRLVIRHGSPN